MNGGRLVGSLTSTRWSGHQRRRTVEEVPSIAVASMRGLERLEPARTHLLATPQGSDGAGFAITLEPALQPLGGYRWWLMCPGCGRRRTRLFESSAGLRCRTCEGLAYETQRMDRLACGRRRILCRLLKTGYSAEEATTVMLHDTPPARLRGMHYRTYQQLREDLEAMSCRSWRLWLAATLDRFPWIALELTHE